MSKSLTFEFFRVDSPSSNGLARLLKSALSKKLDGHPLVFGSKDKKYQISELEKLNDGDLDEKIWVGDLSRIRMDGVPSVVHTQSGIRRAIKLADAEGLGEDTVFVYRPGWRVLLLQRSREGVTTKGFCSLFETLGKLSKPIAVDPVLVPDAYKRFEGFHAIRRVELSVASIDNKAFLKTGDEASNRSISALTDLVNAINSPSIMLTATVGREPKGLLDFSGVNNLVRGMLDLRQMQKIKLRQLKVGGKATDDDARLIDLIADHMRVQGRIKEAKQNQKVISYSARRKAILAAWARRREELRLMYAVARKRSKK